MKNQRNKYADRGVSSKPIALRLPKDVRAQAEALAKAQGVSLNRHATLAYLNGIKQASSDAPTHATCASPRSAGNGTAFFTPQA